VKELRDKKTAKLCVYVWRDEWMAVMAQIFYIYITLHDDGMASKRGEQRPGVNKQRNKK